jgi:hypothetical protein
MPSRALSPLIRQAPTAHSRSAYTDHGQNITLNTRDKFREWTEGWAKAFSDGRITIGLL